MMPPPTCGCVPCPDHQPPGEEWHEGYKTASDNYRWQQAGRDDKRRKITLAGLALYCWGAGMIMGAGGLR
jgi:hypothetical protein